MKSTSSLYILKVIGILVFFSSCEKYIDTKAPTIESFLINENDGSGEVDIDTLNTELEVRAYLKDESGMLSYTITFESKDNDVPGLRVPAYLNAFDTFPIGGAQTEIYKIIKVVTAPDSEGSHVAATGEYNIHLQAKDLSLNESQRATIPMEFRNYAPYIKYQDFETDSIQSMKGIDFLINYFVDDLDNNANTLKMDMYNIFYDSTIIENGGRVDSLIYQFPLDSINPGLAPYVINDTFVFPDTGLYELRILAGDERRNETNSTIVVQVPK